MVTVPRFTLVEQRQQIETVARLAREIWLPHYQPLIGRAQVEYMLRHIQSPEAIEDQIRRGASYTLIGYQGREVGYFCSEPRGETLFISKLYVEAPLRGRGIGGRALAALESEARCAGRSKLALTVNKHNRDSIAAYRAWGFALVKPVRLDIGGGFVMDDYWMEKAILARSDSDQRGRSESPP